MALLLCPGVLTHSFLPKQKCSSSNCLLQTRFRATFSVKITASSSAKIGLESGASKSTNGPAIVWYKHDLRIDDHPGLLAASQHRTLVPLYVFDHRILSRLSDEILELLLFALDDLRKSLKDQGSNLMIRFGNAESVIEELLREVQATSIYAEEEVEYEMRGMLDAVKETLTSVNASSGKECPRMIIWSAQFYDIKNLDNLPASYDEFKKLDSPFISPMSPTELPDADMDLTWGTIPTLDVLKRFLDNSIRTSRNKWISIEEGKLVTTNTKIGSIRKAAAKMSNQHISNNEATQRKRLERSAFVTQQGNIVGGGTSAVLDALAAYLRYLEGTARYEWQEVHQKLRDTETREGASFGVLFGSALLLGIISRRRVYYEAIKYEKERNAGFLSPFGYSAISVAATVNTVCSMEWYWLLALKSQKSMGGICAVRIWRWNGYIIQYAVAGHKGPAVLLVHGFGAFLEHYRDNINHIAEGGKRVWAITLLGFGKSEKPNVVYTELMWAILVRDFIIEVVGGPVHIVGNSIGGYFAAIVAGLWPYLAKSVVLLNSAGNIIPGFPAVNYSDERQTSGAAWFGARLLLLYLRFNIRNIVKNFYPTKPERVDDLLIDEMLRASHDPGVLVVLECIFSLDLSIPLNCLFEGFEKKILVIQGMRDPLSDSLSKLALLRTHCNGITIREIDAGHCPHDEQPVEVNSIIQEWILSVEADASSSSSARYLQDNKAELHSHSQDSRLFPSA